MESVDTMQTIFEVISFIASIASLILAIGAIWLSIVFFKMSEHASKETSKSADKIQSSVDNLASKITHKCTYNSDAVFEQCLPKILTWEAKIYQSYNAHRKISDSEAIKYTEEELRDKHNYWINKKR
ncbi:hypothetical protein PROTEUSMB838_02760 [Proteus sp. MB838]